MPKVNPEQKFRTVFPQVGSPEKRMPLLPTKISDITSDQLGDLQIRYAAWREYAEDKHLEALADYMNAKHDYDLKFDQLYLTSNQTNVTDKKADAAASTELQPLLRKFTDTEIYLKMMAGKLESFSNALAVVSRELTRRGLVP